MSAVRTRPDLAISGEHEELRNMVRKLMADTSSPATVREVMETEDGFDRVTWSTMAQLGLLALLVPERYEGLGQGPVEAGIVFEEMGRALYPGPYFASVALATNALLCSGDEPACSDLLPGIAAGSTIATVAMAETVKPWDGPTTVRAGARRSGDHWILEGSKAFVPNGHVADLLLVTARTHAGLSLFAVDQADPGVETQALTSLDLTRRLAAITFSGARARLVGVDGAAEPVMASTVDRALIALAAEQAGGAARCLELSVEYAKQREQFGRPIGSFQAIAHRCVEMLQRVEFARAASHYAASCEATRADELPVAARVAAAYCGRAYRWVATETIQVHGGLGFTWEHDAHLHYRRSWASETLLGNAEEHYMAIADRLGLGRPKETA
jgi:alkylation response protein AidB-like acyl-CoA dehydrogenase